MKKLRPILLILFFLLSSPAFTQNYKVGDTAPSFQNLQKYEDGVFAGTLSSSDFAGEIVFYNFFGST